MAIAMVLMAANIILFMWRCEMKKKEVHELYPELAMYNELAKQIPKLKDAIRMAANKDLYRRFLTHEKFDTTDARGLPFSDKKGKVIWRRAATKKVKNDNTFTKEWSVVSTADKKGVAIKPKHRSASRYEVCVALENGALDISLHEDGVDEPLFEITKRVDGNWQVMRHIVGEYVSGREYIVLTSNIDKIEVAEGE